MQVGNRVRIISSEAAKDVPRRFVEFYFGENKKGHIMAVREYLDKRNLIHVKRNLIHVKLDYSECYGGEPDIWMKPEWLEVIDEE